MDRLDAQNQAAIALLQSFRGEGNAAEQQADGALIEALLAEDGLTDRSVHPAG